MHAELELQKVQEKDIAGGALTSNIDDQTAQLLSRSSMASEGEFNELGAEYPTQEEVNTLRHVPYCTPTSPSTHALKPHPQIMGQAR